MVPRWPIPLIIFFSTEPNTPKALCGLRAFAQARKGGVSTFSDPRLTPKPSRKRQRPNLARGFLDGDVQFQSWEGSVEGAARVGTGSTAHCVGWPMEFM